MRNRRGQRHPRRSFLNGQLIDKELRVFVVIVGIGAQAQAYPIHFECRRHHKLETPPVVGPGVDVAADIRPGLPAIIRELGEKLTAAVVDPLGP